MGEVGKHFSQFLSIKANLYKNFKGVKMKKKFFALSVLNVLLISPYAQADEPKAKVETKLEETVSTTGTQVEETKPVSATVKPDVQKVKETKLEKTVVTANRYETPTDQVGSSVTVITSKEIEDSKKLLFLRF